MFAPGITGCHETLGAQEPGRGADSGADGEQSAALSDRRDFAPDRKPFQTPSS